MSTAEFDIDPYEPSAEAVTMRTWLEFTFELAEIQGSLTGRPYVHYDNTNRHIEGVTYDDEGEPVELVLIYQRKIDTYLIKIDYQPLTGRLPAHLKNRWDGVIISPLAAEYYDPDTEEQEPFTSTFTTHMVGLLNNFDAFPVSVHH